MIVTYFSHSLGPKKLVWFMTENHFRYLQTRNVQKYIPLRVFFVWIWILALQPSNLQRLPACLIKRNWKSNLSIIKLIGTLTFNGWNWKILNWLTKEASSNFNCYFSKNCIPDFFAVNIVNFVWRELKWK